MKHRIEKAVCFALLLCLLPLSAFAGGKDLVWTVDKAEQWVDASRYIVYPKFVAKDPALAPAVDKINQSILDTASIPAYLQLLPTVQPGGTGLVVNYTYVASTGAYASGKCYLSLLIEAKGKMLKGPPSQVYYPMVFQVESGTRVTFDQVFSDPEGAKAYIEQYLTNVVEPTLSTYLENNQLFPVPYESFAFSGEGHITFYNPHDQHSVLSGTSGAISFRYSELWDYLDTSENGVAMQLLQSGDPLIQYTENRDHTEFQEFMDRWCKLGELPGLYQHAPSLGTSMDQVAQRYAITTDSGFYPGGAYLETETPELRGTYLLTDENESYIFGILTGRVDMFGIETGKTTAVEAKALLGAPVGEFSLDEAAAQMYLVCPGTAAVYSYSPEFPIHRGETGEDATSVSLTLYADGSGIVQYIKLSLE